MKRVRIFVFLGAFVLGCSKNSSQQFNNNPIILNTRWQYIYSGRCPYNPASEAPCYAFSLLDQASWVPDSSYMIVDTVGNVYQRIQGINGLPVISDAFQVKQINSTLLDIIPTSTHPATYIKIIALEDHLLVLEYIAQPFGTTFGLDSLVK